MDQSAFFETCSLAFLTVFVLLSVLALAMRAITAVFPARRTAVDAAVVAAIAASVSSAVPGARLVKIEEIPCSSPRPPRRSE